MPDWVIGAARVVGGLVVLYFAWKGWMFVFHWTVRRFRLDVDRIWHWAGIVFGVCLIPAITSPTFNYSDTNLWNEIGAPHWPFRVAIWATGVGLLVCITCAVIDSEPRRSAP